MRIDKYLKLTRLIKRRTVAAEACTLNRVTINDKTAKPSSEVKIGDRIKITYGSKILSITVKDTNIIKNDAEAMYSIEGTL